MNNETYDPPTEKVLKNTNDIIELMKPLEPFDVKTDVLGGIIIHYESEDKNREINLILLNDNNHELNFKIKNPPIINGSYFSEYDIPHLKRFILGYSQEDLEDFFNPKPHVWLHDIYTFVSKNKDEEAIDLMFQKIGDLLDNGDFKVVNEILPTIDLRKLNLNLLVGLLSITRYGTDKPSDFLASYYEPSLLPYRPKLVEEIEKIMYEIEPTERIDKLLEGLDGRHK